MNIEQKFNFNFDISELKQKNNIVVFFLSSKEQTKDNFLAFPEALQNNLAEVEEVSEKGFIGNLRISNKSDQKLLILGSEILVGSKLKQNRVVDETAIVSENSTTTLRVSCCEKNRWSPAVSENISLSDTLLFSKARTNNAEDIYNSKQNKTDQFRVWEDIDEKFEEYETKSFTSSVEDIYKKRTSNVEEIVKYFQPGDNDLGVVFGIGSRLVSLDVFSSNKILKIYLPRLIRSVALDSFKRTNYKSFLKTKDVYKFLRLIEHADKRTYNCMGTTGSLGNYVRFNDQLVAGLVLNLNRKTVHFSAHLKELSTTPDYKSKVA